MLELCSNASRRVWGEGLRRISRPADLPPILKDDAETAVLYHIEGVVEAVPKIEEP